MDVSGGDVLPTVKVGDVTSVKRESWLIEDLWLSSGCGILGGLPKSWKSWLGLDMAVSVSSGTPCLGRFAAKEQGPTLVYLAEDLLEDVRDRVAAICRGRGLSHAGLDLTLITSPVLRLDSEVDQDRLRRTIELHRPRLLLLDPLVRLHRLNENDAREISGLLGYLRELQRTYDVAVVLTHHAGKRASSRPGQMLRGTGDLYAFVDSLMYLHRQGDEAELSIEHRSAAAREPLQVRLATEDDAIQLQLCTRRAEDDRDDLPERVMTHLRRNSALSRADLRKALRVNNQRLGEVLASLSASRLIIQTPDGFVPAPTLYPS